VIIILVRLFVTSNPVTIAFFDQVLVQFLSAYSLSSLNSSEKIHESEKINKINDVSDVPAHRAKISELNCR